MKTCNCDPTLDDPGFICSACGGTIVASSPAACSPLPSAQFDKGDHPYDDGYWMRYDGKPRPKSKAEAEGWDALDAELAEENAELRDAGEGVK